MSKTTYSRAMPDDKPGNEHRKEINYNYSADFTQRVTETRKITLHDGGTMTLKAHGTTLTFPPATLRLLWVLDLLQQQGNEIVTMADVYSGMGYSGNWLSMSGPMKSWLKGLNATEVVIETESGDTDGGYLLPVEYRTVTENGVPAAAADFEIKINGEQPIAKYLRATGQYYKVDFEIFDTPFPKTPNYMALENYCINMVMTSECDSAAVISGINGPAGCHFNNRDMRQNINRLFEHFKDVGVIKDYIIKFDSLTQKDMVYYKK